MPLPRAEPIQSPRLKDGGCTPRHSGSDAADGGGNGVAADAQRGTPRGGPGRNRDAAGPADRDATDHWVYLCFDRRRRLLYVGVTSDGMQRFRQGHGKRAAWWRDVVSIEVEHFDTRDAALARERDLIRSAFPEHNVVHARRRVRRRGELPERWMQLEEIAALLEVNAEWVADRLGEMPHVLLAGSPRFKAREVVAWFESRAAAS